MRLVNRNSFRLRTPERAEDYINRYLLPGSVVEKLSFQHPEFNKDQLAMMGVALKEWLICCAWRDGRQLGMPSRALDWAWHEFILNTPAYISFCEEAYGSYLHHVPEGDMSTNMESALANTVRAWDKSQIGKIRESSMWSLDKCLGIPNPLGLSKPELSGIREAHKTV